MLKNFTVREGHPLADAATIWGGGHTRETLPTNKGWRARATCKDSPTLLGGRPGVKGCFTAQLVPALVVEGQKVADGYIDLAVYSETPEEVLAALKEANGSILDPTYHRQAYHPGWGLTAISLVEQQIESDEQYQRDLENDRRYNDLL